jgi:hypothetical protein
MPRPKTKEGWLRPLGYIRLKVELSLLYSPYICYFAPPRHNIHDSNADVRFVTSTVTESSLVALTCWYLIYGAQTLPCTICLTTGGMGRFSPGCASL